MPTQQTPINVVFRVPRILSSYLLVVDAALFGASDARNAYEHIALSGYVITHVILKIVVDLVSDNVDVAPIVFHIVGGRLSPIALLQATQTARVTDDNYKTPRKKPS